MSDPEVADLHAPRYLFFFSYARLDNDQYLEKFFEDLDARVRQMTAHPEPSYRDMSKIEPGDDWPDELVTALQESQTMLCVYSPSYFTREFCGKEFTIFLERQGLRPDADGSVSGSRRIIPVLWMREKDLDRLNLPPAAVRAIHYLVQAHPEVYRQKGLSGILRATGRRGKYQEILDEIADLIVDRALPMLPPLPEKPALKDVRNAFAELPMAEAGGPRVLRAFYIAADAAQLEAALPFATVREGSLRAAVSEVGTQHGACSVERLLDPASPTFAEELAEGLRSATARNELALVVAATPLVDAALAELLRRVAADPGWRGGIIFAGPAGDASPQEHASAVAAGLGHAASGLNHTHVKAFAGDLGEFRVAVARLIEQLQRGVVAAGTIRRQLSAQGPGRRPIVAGPRENVRS